MLDHWFLSPSRARKTPDALPRTPRRSDPRRRRSRLIAQHVFFLFSAGLLQPNSQARPPDTTYYPLRAHPLAGTEVAGVVFAKVFETTVAGLPSPDPLLMSSDRLSVTIRTRAGEFAVATLPPQKIPGFLDSPGTLCRWQGGRPPSWYHRLRPPPAGEGGCIEGPDRMIAILSPDGTVCGRGRSNGHLLWRRTATHRLSRTGASLGPYLIVAADAARSVEIYRWADGTPAGSFQLTSEDSTFASAPIVAGGRVYILAVDSPRDETRLLVLELRPVSDQPPVQGRSSK